MSQLVIAIEGHQPAPAASDELQARLRSLELSVQGAGAKLVVRIIMSGATANPAAALAAKDALQTQQVYEPAPLYHAAQPKQVRDFLAWEHQLGDTREHASRRTLVPMPNGRFASCAAARLDGALPLR